MTTTLSMQNIVESSVGNGSTEDGRQWNKAANIVGVPIQIVGAEIRPAYLAKPGSNKVEAVFLYYLESDLEEIGMEEAPFYATSFASTRMVNTAKHLLAVAEADEGSFPEIPLCVLVEDHGPSGEWVRQQFGKFPYTFVDYSTDVAQPEPEPEPAPAPKPTTRPAARTGATTKRPMVHAG